MFSQDFCGLVWFCYFVEVLFCFGLVGLGCFVVWGGMVGFFGGGACFVF